MLRNLFFILMVWCSWCQTHEGRPVYVEMREEERGSYLLKWKIPPVMPSGQEPHISVTGSGCEPLLDAPPGRKRNLGLIGRAYYSCDKNVSDLSIILTYPGINPALTSLVIYQDLDGKTKQIFSDPEKMVIPLLRDVNAMIVAKEYGLAGVKHILKGYDHLAFVLCLMLIAQSGRRLIYTVTGFTIAHSITLSLATLNLVRLPSLFVETLIALSILLLAIEIYKNRFEGKLSFTWRYPILTAGLFGLLHGFGFASVLADLGLPDELKLPALLFFNIGVELGQLAFIGFNLTILLLLTKTNSWVRENLRALDFILIYFLGGLGAYWVIERVLSW